ncbi:MAG: trypsin-like peptidase domain-containing protein [Planctomycetes bacterium]|nr:trypsin-like peptidase domain-containing protein [Planctomycetota bacterium]
MVLRRTTSLYVIAVSYLLACCLLTSGARAVEPASSNWLARIRLLPGENERSHRTIKAAFHEAVSDANKYTVSFHSDGSQVALGTIIDSDGYIVTKASEVQADVTCRLGDGRTVATKLVSLHSEYDLALLKVNATQLPAVRWGESSKLTAGSWLATTSPTLEPTAIGIVSSPARPLPKPQAILGVGLEQFGELTRVNRVIEGSAASNAGLQIGDVIASVNGQAMDRPQTVSATIRSLLPGDHVSLVIKRSGRSLSVPAVLGDATRVGNLEQVELMESLGGPLSKRRSGFPYVLEHDTVLRPKDCGGPLVDLDGNAVGINIARVSRVASYALPASAIKPILADMMAGKFPAPTGPIALETVSTGE